MTRSQKCLSNCARLRHGFHYPYVTYIPIIKWNQGINVCKHSVKDICCCGWHRRDHKRFYNKNGIGIWIVTNISLSCNLQDFTSCLNIPSRLNGLNSFEVFAKVDLVLMWHKGRGWVEDQLNIPFLLTLRQKASSWVLFCYLIVSLKWTLGE